jgi:hypothetical protein
MTSKHRELPKELEERKAIYRDALALQDLLCEPIPIGHRHRWRPVSVLPAEEPCPSLQRSELQPARDAMPYRFEITNPFRSFNLRIADVSCAVPELANSLRVAGLSDEDCNSWASHRMLAADIRERCGVVPRQAERPREPDGVFFVHDMDNAEFFMGNFDAEEAHRIRAADALVERLWAAVDRIMRTVSPEAVLERLRVSDDRKQVAFDGEPFKVSPRRAGTYLYHLRRAGGEVVSSNQIAEDEGLGEFRSDRALDTLQRKHPRLARIIEATEGRGGRIILPLPRS